MSQFSLVLSQLPAVNIKHHVVRSWGDEVLLSALKSPSGPFVVRHLEVDRDNWPPALLCQLELSKAVFGLDVAAAVKDPNRVSRSPTGTPSMMHECSPQHTSEQ